MTDYLLEHVFDDGTSTERIFLTIGQPLIDACLEGINSNTMNSNLLTSDPSLCFRIWSNFIREDFYYEGHKQLSRIHSTGTQ